MALEKWRIKITKVDMEKMAREWQEWLKWLEQFDKETKPGLTPEAKNFIIRA